jgi:hypothetical protein
MTFPDKGDYLFDKNTTDVQNTREGLFGKMIQSRSSVTKNEETLLEGNLLCESK